MSELYRKARELSEYYKNHPPPPPIFYHENQSTSEDLKVQVTKIVSDKNMQMMMDNISEYLTGVFGTETMIGYGLVTFGGIVHVAVEPPETIKAECISLLQAKYANVPHKVL